MRPESDATGDVQPIAEPGTPSTNPGRPASGRVPGTKAFTGGYYWLPAPDAGGITWSVVTCRDLRCGPDAGHDADLWPRLIERLAAAWGKAPQELKRRLGQSYTGLPRGRVTRPGKEFLILHGNDSPVPGWQKVVTEGFRPGRTQAQISLRPARDHDPRTPPGRRVFARMPTLEPGHSSMTEPFQLSGDECSFLTHWTWEATSLSVGPAWIWCVNHQVSSAYAPYPMAEVLWAREIEAGRWDFMSERPLHPIPGPLGGRRPVLAEGRCRPVPHPPPAGHPEIHSLRRHLANSGHPHPRRIGLPPGLQPGDGRVRLRLPHQSRP